MTLSTIQEALIEVQEVVTFRAGDVEPLPRKVLTESEILLIVGIINESFAKIANELAS